uniref:Uncharacterized protein n=1 Tax=Timema genevievae TaxID=629358 RepID=A0A7R9K6L1_TIMGE|nr:unnamed protein product [Timema genevievae]
MESETVKNKVNPREDANIFSVIFFVWTIKLFKTGYSKAIEEEDLFETLKEDRSKLLGNNLEKNWAKEVERAGAIKTNASLFRALVKTFSWDFVMLGLFVFANDVIIRISQPLLLGQLLKYFEPGSTMPKEEAYLYAGGIVIITGFSSLYYSHYLLKTAHLGMKMRIACCSLIYRKALRLSHAALGKTNAGHVVNMLSNDVSRFDLICMFVHYLWAAPVISITITYFLWISAGWPGMIGISVVFLFVPIQAYSGKMTSVFRHKTALKTDERVRLMDEIISGVRVIKMYAWEKPFSELIKVARKAEIKNIKMTSYLRGIYMSFTLFTNRVALYSVLVAIVLMGGTLTADKVFVYASFFSVLGITMAGFFNRGVAELAETLVSIERLQDFMIKEEIIPVPPDKMPAIENQNDEKKVAILKDLSAKWDGKANENTINEINIQVGHGKLIAIIGQVGTGKTSLLQAILGELPKESGSCVVNGKISYACQEPWVFGSTIRQNIVFGSTFNKTRYEEVLRVCALLPDLEQLPQRDLTLVGERGSSLSGGQKARVNLARAVYNDADVYLLDDPLSAVDTHVGKHLFDECPWVFGSTIRQNIVFGSTFNKTRYEEVLRVCALLPDLEQLPQRDLTLVGERGSSLSGGQKARVNLARAVYNDADVYLLDDPLSAVDTHVGKHLFDECIKSYLKHKTRILVTHQLQYLTDVDSIVLLLNGEVQMQGTFRDLIDSQFDYVKLLGDEEDGDDDDDNEIISTDDVGVESDEDISNIKKVLRRLSRRSIKVKTPKLGPWQGRSKKNQPVEEEAISDDTIYLESYSKGESQSSTYMEYFKSGTNYFFIFLMAALFLLAQGAASLADYWASFWTIQEEMRNYYRSMDVNIVTLSKENMTAYQIDMSNSRSLVAMLDLHSTEFCLYMYTGIILILSVLAGLRSYMFYKICVRCSERLHNNMFNSVIRTTMRFFDLNPSGRILNRFSKDIGCADELLTKSMMDAAQYMLTIAGSIVLAVVVNYLLIVLIIILGILLWFIRKVYLKTSINIKRLEGITKSPVFTHLNATLQGISTIRAYGAQSILKDEFDKHQDLHTSAYYMFITTSSAFGFSLDSLCFIYISLVTFSFLFLKEAMGGSVGLAITQSLLLIFFLQWGLRQTTEVANNMMSVERILEYKDLEEEPLLESTPDKTPSPEWPKEGRIMFQNTSLKYVETSPPVLKDLNISIQPREKVGIVGRTGAGKSSLIAALFRLARVEGTIRIDGIDTKDIGLQDLRSRISIIPQDPVLFSGTLRNNMDPFHEFTDCMLWSALEDVELKKYCVSSNGLDMKVTKGGGNFSVGQRQLICLARAILRNNKILMLDEATANVDPQTDALIQNTIRLKFADCTVLTVAHRLNTIMDSDKVLVMDAGRMVEFASPHNLLQNKNGYFYQMVQKTGKKMAEQLSRVSEGPITPCISSIPIITEQLGELPSIGQTSISERSWPRLLDYHKEVFYKDFRMRNITQAGTGSLLSHPSKDSCHKGENNSSQTHVFPTLTQRYHQ